MVCDGSGPWHYYSSSWKTTSKAVKFQNKLQHVYTVQTEIRKLGKGRHTRPKKCFFRGGGGEPLCKKTLFYINGENSPESCVIKMLFYEGRHFTPQTFLLIRKQYLAKKIRLFNTKNLGEKNVCLP